VVLGVILTLGVVLFFVLKPNPKVDFATDVKPILNKHCISCHGGVKKNAGFSVLFESEAMGVTESGIPAIIPGSARKSELIKRLHHTDPEMRMPYQKAALSPEEIKTLTDWINQGANWGTHWAYLPVEKTDVPQARAEFIEKKFFSNPVDHFIAARMEEKQLSPNPLPIKTSLEGDWHLTLPACHLIPIFLIYLQQDKSVMKTMWTVFLQLLPMEKNGPVGGWIWPDTPIRWDLKKTLAEPFGNTAIGSSRRSTETFLMINLPSNSSQGTCFLNLPMTNSSQPLSTETP